MKIVSPHSIHLRAWLCAAAFVLSPPGLVLGFGQAKRRQNRSRM